MKLYGFRKKINREFLRIDILSSFSIFFRIAFLFFFPLITLYRMQDVDNLVIVIADHFWQINDSIRRTSTS